MSVRLNERLDHMGHGTAQQPEIDAFLRDELDCLNGDRHESAADRSAVCGQDHVAAAFQYLDFVGEGTGSSAQVRLGKQRVHRCPVSGDLHAQRAEGTEAPSPAGIEDQRAGDGSQIDQPESATSTTPAPAMKGRRIIAETSRRPDVRGSRPCSC
jgi:hypothetical protein